MPEIDVAKAFTMTHETTKEKISFGKGKHEVDEDIASHFYVRAHLVGAKPNPAAGTPAFMRAAAEERMRLEAEHAKLEAEMDARVTANVRQRMEAEMGERIRVALEDKAEAATKAETLKSLGVPGLGEMIEAIVAERLKAAVEDALAQTAAAKKAGK